jgi:hypothetical protein
MSPASWMLLACLAAGPDPRAGADVSALVGRLGAARFAEREAAAAGLRALGRDALPALRSALDDRDAEVKARARALLERIESELLVRPTLVRLDHRDRPVADVVKDLADQSGMAVALGPDLGARPPRRPITLRTPGPLPFWRALDLLGAEARLHADLAPQPAPGAEGIAAGIVLGDGPSEGGFTSDDGPFRVELLGAHYQRDRTLKKYPGAGLAPPVSEQFYLQAQVLAEPRLAIGQAGNLRLTEADDDLGQSLLPPGPAADAPGGPEPALLEFNAGPSLAFPIPLARPDRPGRAIRRLRGILPVVVAARRDDPLVVPLAGAPGKTFRRGDLSLAVEAIRADPDGPQTIVELTVRPGPGASSAAPGPLFLEQQIEARDARGRHLGVFPQETSVRGGEVRLTLALAPAEGAAPAELRYHGLTRTTAEVAFDFADVPMP